jgi:hypothetical protein
VLVYSLNQTNTKHDIVVLVLDEVTPTVRKRLEYLGAIIINVDQVKNKIKSQPILCLTYSTKKKKIF